VPFAGAGDIFCAIAQPTAIAIEQELNTKVAQFLADPQPKALKELSHNASKHPQISYKQSSFVEFTQD